MKLSPVSSNGRHSSRCDEGQLLEPDGRLEVTEFKSSPPPPRKEPSSKQCAPISARSDRRNLLMGHEFPFSETQIGVIDR